MKVLCIKDSPDYMFSRKGKVFVPADLRVHFGKYYNVVNKVTGYKGQQLYILSERPANYRYKVDYFSPCSNIDERDFKIEATTQTACEKQN